MDSEQVVINRDRLEDHFALGDTERGSGRGLQAAARTRNVPHRIMLQTTLQFWLHSQGLRVSTAMM